MKKVEIALYTKLTGSASLEALVDDRIYLNVAPPEAEYPFVVFQQMTGASKYTFNTEKWRDLVYQVKAVDQSRSKQAAQAIDEVLNTLLNLQPLTLSAGETLVVMRQTNVDYIEEVSNEIFVHIGADYLISAEV